VGGGGGCNGGGGGGGVGGGGGGGVGRVELDEVGPRSKRVRRAVLPELEGPTRRIDGRVEYDGPGWRMKCSMTGTKKTTMKPTMKTVGDGVKAASRKGVIRSKVDMVG